MKHEPRLTPTPGADATVKDERMPPPSRHPLVRLFSARAGLIAGVIIWINGNESVGRAYVIYLCLFAFLAGIALLTGWL